jgi:hypothetical protein
MPPAFHPFFGNRMDSDEKKRDSILSHTTIGPDDKN